MYDKKRLISLIREKSLSRGEFRFVSGQTSNNYIDLSKVVMLSEGLEQIAWGFDQVDAELFWDEFDSIGGPAMGAIPLVTAMMILTDIERSFFVRKESKEHGLCDLIEGNLQAGDRVLMLEDVTTTGGSLLKAVEAVESKGGVIKRIYSVVDREAGAKELFEKKGYVFTSLLSISEIL